MKHCTALSCLIATLITVGCGADQSNTSQANRSVSQDEVGPTDSFVPSGADKSGYQKFVAFDHKEEADASRTDFDVQKADAAGNICIFDIGLTNRTGVIHQGYLRRVQDRINALSYKLLLGLQDSAPNLEALKFARTIILSNMGKKVEPVYASMQQSCVAGLRTGFEAARKFHMTMVTFEGAYDEKYNSVDYAAVRCAAQKYVDSLPQKSRLGQATINGIRASVDFLVNNIVFGYRVDDLRSIKSIENQSVQAFKEGRPAAAEMLKTVAQCWDGTL